MQKDSHGVTGRVDDPPLPRPLQTRTRKPFPESLPRDENRLTQAESCCPDCSDALSYLVEKAAEQLKLMRSAFSVIRNVQAPASRPKERGIAGPELLVQVLTSKYAEHTPLNWHSEIYERHGVTLRRSLLSGWVDACCQLLSPLDETLLRFVLTDGKLHADDTSVPVLLPANGIRKRAGCGPTCVKTATRARRCSSCTHGP